MDAVKQLGVRGLNHVLAGASWATGRLARHAGARIRLVCGMLTLQLAIDEHGLLRLIGAGSPDDVTLTLPADAPLRALFEPERVFSAVKLDGAVDIAETLAFVFRNLRWDAEADLAALIGDIAAHRLVRLGRALGVNLRAALANTAANIGEYASEEAGLIVPRRDFAAFGAEVNRLRDDLARLEKRMERIGRPD